MGWDAIKINQLINQSMIKNILPINNYKKVLLVLITFSHLSNIILEY